jgi:hypothetical protein
LTVGRLAETTVLVDPPASINRKRENAPMLQSMTDWP